MHGREKVNKSNAQLLMAPDWTQPQKCDFGWELFYEQSDEMCGPEVVARNVRILHEQLPTQFAYMFDASKTISSAATFWRWTRRQIAAGLNGSNSTEVTKEILQIAATAMAAIIVLEYEKQDPEDIINDAAIVQTIKNVAFTEDDNVATTVRKTALATYGITRFLSDSASVIQECLEDIAQRFFPSRHSRRWRSGEAEWPLKKDKSQSRDEPLLATAVRIWGFLVASLLSDDAVYYIVDRYFNSLATLLYTHPKPDVRINAGGIIAMLSYIGADKFEGDDITDDYNPYANVDDDDDIEHCSARVDSEGNEVGGLYTGWIDDIRDKFEELERSNNRERVRSKEVRKTEHEERAYFKALLASINSEDKHDFFITHHTTHQTSALYRFHMPFFAVIQLTNWRSIFLLDYAAKLFGADYHQLFERNEYFRQLLILQDVAFSSSHRLTAPAIRKVSKSLWEGRNQTTKRYRRNAPKNMVREDIYGGKWRDYLPKESKDKTLRQQLHAEES